MFRPSNKSALQLPGSAANLVLPPAFMHTTADCHPACQGAPEPSRTWALMSFPRRLPWPPSNLTVHLNLDPGPEQLSSYAMAILRAPRKGPGAGGGVGVGGEWGGEGKHTSIPAVSAREHRANVVTARAGLLEKGGGSFEVPLVFGPPPSLPAKVGQPWLLHLRTLFGGLALMENFMFFNLGARQVGAWKVKSGCFRSSRW